MRTGCGKRFADVTQGCHVMVGYDSLIFGNAIPATGITMVYWLEMRVSKLCTWGKIIDYAPGFMASVLGRI